MITMSFPGLGIQEFSVDPVLFSFGKIEVRWYGLIITLGIILALTYCAYRSKQAGISFDDLLDIALFTIPCSVIGARLYYVLTSLDEFHSFGEVIAIWNGGIAIYGAIIAGAITIFCVCRYKKISVLKMLDIVGPAVMIGQILGRWGNFFNGEAYGSEVLEGNLLYFMRMGLIPNMESATQMHYFHPTFFYESIWNLLGFILIQIFYKKRKFDGQIVLSYLTWYGFGRMFIEGLRTDSLYVGVFRISQVVGFVCFVVCGILLIVNLVKANRQRITDSGYNPTYAKISHYGTSTAENEDTDALYGEEESGEENEGSEADTSEEAHTLSDETIRSMEDKFRHLFNNENENDKDNKED